MTGSAIKVKVVLFFVFLILALPSRYLLAGEFPRYEIDAVIDTAAHKIKARQKVVFVNNSDIPLNEACFHIYPHREYTQSDISFLYRYAGYFKVNPFPEGFQSGDLRVEKAFSGQDSLKFSEFGQDQTILKVELVRQVDPGESCEINLVFNVDIPHSYGRFGWHRKIISLNRWYPLLSVHDNQGWHNYPFYIYHHPYFSDAAYYSLKLTLPQKEVVAATGVLNNEQLNADGTKSLYFETEAPVRDFAVGISPDFLVHSLDDQGIRINSYYLKGDETRARDAAENARDLMRFNSRRFGEYPYSQFSIVPNYLGYGGDQSSAFIFIDTRVYKLPRFLDRYFDFLISHETSHQWFYNIIGSDEYREMFMDEGMNSYWVLEYLESRYGKNAQVLDLPKLIKPFIPNFSFRDSTALRYIFMAKSGLDRPVIGELSSFQEPSSIFALTYGKGSAILDMLKGQIGEAVFNRVIGRYASEFRFKNISLKEFIRICNEESGRDLNWFFEQWLKTSKICDYAVKEVRPDKVTLENRGQIQMPVAARVTFADGSSKDYDWDGKNKYFFIPLRENKIKSVQIDPDDLITLDLDRTNNSWPKKTHFKLVPLYLFVYELPVLLPQDSYNLVAGPQVGGSSLGLGASAQKPFDGLVRLSSVYDFNGKAFDSTLGYEFPHLFNQQTAVGFEIFDYESSKAGNDVSGGKLYLRKELWPASYGVFDSNDHFTIYLVRDQKLESTASFNGKEEINNLHYRKREEAIAGVTGTFGRYGPYADPVRGWKVIPTQEFAGHFLGGTEDFWRSSAELDNYRLIFPKYQHTAASKIKLGCGGPADKKLFQLGGAEGLRGYGMKTIEGSQMFLSSLEYRLPLSTDIKMYSPGNIFSLDKVQAVAFFDAGKAWYSDFDSADFKKDAGVGLRLHFDMVGFLEKAVLRIDFARAINDPKEDPHLWFGISQAF
ncbi:MAG: M1 family aminopeptidase [Candidatus Omnitrophica bacterium]|nr:BamA/TamA family outer membrane protein [Candidatus Omnitrophota bacterium]MDD5079978.1 M1 family aminopeptidase [Candidatus Omnitrophota bacterium]